MLVHHEGLLVEVHQGAARLSLFLKLGQPRHFLLQALVHLGHRVLHHRQADLGVVVAVQSNNSSRYSKNLVAFVTRVLDPET